MGVTPQTVLVTGAGGFLGRAVVADILGRGDAVRALVRASQPGARRDGAETVALDLAVASAAQLAKVLAGVDVVIHLATALSGDWSVQERDTLEATRRLTRAMGAAPNPPRLVLASSIAVYSADAALEGAVIDEDAPLETTPLGRDSYARAKLAQEQIAQSAGLMLTILRPGAILGPGRVINAHLGVGIGPVLILLETRGEVPVVAVSDCARAFGLAAEGTGAGGVYNILGDACPTRTEYVTALRKGGWPRGVIPLSWRILHGLARALAPLGPRLPGLLRPATLRARMMPVRYSNAHAKSGLGWHPEQTFEPALRAALEATP
ncbi:Nucleoside-diphosphate-sugar epimerase [Roseovarius marisflavi]|uniref:Nucleoside-diphosphate-sugar epimerase n=1 Tax=Roseovarius marisflavi TaxID=1054996 RepID=A0A1M7BLT4_9RHOB|nr:NAD(P)-dependent oxidoreductase [Roseovarius marisflavi]SHL55931.1 Nucleoside-diphosphate-sugar epimerase [Roseovarius marisflavi]